MGPGGSVAGCVGIARPGIGVVARGGVEGVMDDSLGRVRFDQVAEGIVGIRGRAAGVGDGLLLVQIVVRVADGLSGFAAAGVSHLLQQTRLRAAGNVTVSRDVAVEIGMRCDLIIGVISPRFGRRDGCAAHGDCRKALDNLITVLVVAEGGDVTGRAVLIRVGIRFGKLVAG